MKIIFKNLIILSVGAVLALSSCTTNLESINTNPNEPTTDNVVPTPYILTDIMRDIAYNHYDHWSNLRQWAVCAQLWCQVNYSEEDRYEFRSDVTDSYFTETYTYASNAQHIIDLATETPDNVAAYGDAEMQTATATILKCWLIMNVCQVMGDVPYTQALNYAEYPTPAYDTQETIFKGVIEELKGAYDILKSNPEGWSSGDMIYGGDSEKWAKFANSLRLRYAMRLTNIDNSYALSEAASAVSDGVFESNADNAIFTFAGTDYPNYSGMYYGFSISARNDYSMSRGLSQLMRGLNDDRDDYTNIFEGVYDPRHAIYIGGYSASAGLVNGQAYGMPTSDNGSFFSAKANMVTSYDYTQSPLAIVADYDSWSTFMDYTNVLLFRAELEGNSASLFEEGIRASFEQWSAADDYSLIANYAGGEDVETYIDNVMAKFNAATEDEKLEMIITQKYIHNYGHFNQEPWFEYNRTGYPKSLIEPGEVTVKVDSDFVADPNGEPQYFTALTSNTTRVATRLPYPVTEFTTNATNINAAVSNMGGNTVNTVLWWQKQ